MPIDFSLPSHVEQSQRDIADFIDTVVIPRQQAAFAGGLTDAVRRELQSAAKAAQAPIWHSARLVAGDRRDTEPSLRAKVFVSEAVSRIVELWGGLGTATELVIGRMYVMRPFQIYDGALEAHRMSIAKRAARRAAAATPQLVGP